MRIFKKIIATLLVVVMCLTSAPLQGFVGLEWPSLPEINFGNFELPKLDFGSWFSSKASAATEGYYTYTVTNGKATITRVNTSISGDVVIPSTLGGYSVTTIGDWAFNSCDSLTSITIPDSVTTIGDRAFYSCDSLTSVTIPDSATTIGLGVFCYCHSLTSIVVDADNPAYSSDSRGALFDKNKTILIQYPIGNTNSSYSIPNSVTTIGGWAFDSCDSLTSITIGDSVTTIGDDAFAYCRSLISITIPNSVTTIDDYAFNYCNNLTDVYYTGTQEQWQIINIGSSNENLTNATIHYNYKETTSEFKTGDIIQFGSYPQTKVTDETLIAELNALAPVWENWTSYGYYSGTGDYGTMKQGDWMRYVDIKHDGERYRGVKFTQYRPYYTWYQSSSSNTQQATNGYSTNTVYWFKFESIDWRVLDPATGLVMCETIIDSQPYSNTIYKNSSASERYAYFNDYSYTNYASDYETSSIRKWLNNDFYNTAFTDTEKKKINITTLNNDGYYTSVGTSGYEALDSNSTKDKIFLLSYDEATNSKFGFNSSSLYYDTARSGKGSDYAQSQGLVVNINSESYGGNSTWHLRSSGDRSCNCCAIDYEGYFSELIWMNNAVDFTSNGVRLALRSNLDEIVTEDDDNNSNFTGEISGVLTAWDGLGNSPKAYIDDVGYIVYNDDALYETLFDNLLKKVVCEVKDGVIISCKSANFEEDNTNLHFEKSNYTFYVGERDDVNWDDVYLNYYADQSIIDNFDDSTVSITVSNPEIVRFNGVTTDNTSEKNTAKIECFIVALKPGTTTLTATMPNGLKSVCTITVLQSNQIVMNIENTDTHYQANRFFFDKNGEYSSDAIEISFMLQNVTVEDCYYFGDDDEINDNLTLNNVKVEFKLKDNAFALSPTGADKRTIIYDNIKFNELKEDILKVYCIDENASNSYLGKQLEIEVYVYFDDPVTGNNIEQGKDVVNFTVQSYEAKYVKEHAEALGVGEDYHDYYVNCFSENMIGLEDEFEFFWWKTMSKSFTDNAISLFTDFNEVNGYEIVIADILSILTSENYDKQSEMFGNAFFDFCCSVYETLLDVLGETYINKLFSEISGKTEEYTLGTVVAVMSGDVTKGPAFEMFDKLLKNNKVIEAMDNATFIGGMINKLLVTHNIMKDTISGMQKAAVIWSAYDAYKEIITSNDEVLGQLKEAAKAKENEPLVKALENYLNFDDKKMWQKVADGIADTVVNGGGSAIQLGLQSLSKTVLGNFDNKILHVFGSVASGILSGFELGRLLSDSLCNAGDYAEASCAVVSAGYISVALKDVILDLLLELGNSLGGEMDYSKAQKLDFALKMFKSVETLAYKKTIDGLNARGSSIIGGYLSKNKKEEQSRVIADLLAQKASLEKIECHDTNLEEIYAKICDDLYIKGDSGNLSDALYFTSYKTLCIQCPVDVLVTNSKSEVVAQIINDEIISQVEGIEIVVCEHEKYICVPDTDEYNIIITATDAGKMDYTVFEYNENGDNIREVEYSNIPLYNGQKITGKIDKLNLAKSDSYNLTTDSKTIYADKDEYLLSEGHKYTASIINSTCTENGKRVYTCTCGDTYTETIEAIGHDFDGSRCKKCDFDKADNCSCKCHKKGIAKFFFKIGLFFQKIFKKNKVCKCGIYHY